MQFGYFFRGLKSKSGYFLGFSKKISEEHTYHFNVKSPQPRAYKSALKIFVDELKVEVKEIRKEVDELKLSVNFMTANYEEMKTKHAKVDTELTAVYRQIEVLSQNLNEGLYDRKSDPDAKVIPTM